MALSLDPDIAAAAAAAAADGAATPAAPEVGDWRTRRAAFVAVLAARGLRWPSTPG